MYDQFTFIESILQKYLKERSSIKKVTLVCMFQKKIYYEVVKNAYCYVDSQP